MPRHERRRRLFADDAPGVSNQPARQLASDGNRAAATKTYSDAAQRARERAVMTLLPARLGTIGLAVGAGLLAVVACLAFEVGASALAPRLAGEEAVRLQLDAAGSVAGWLASAVLASAGATALFIYSLRRHRIDDYHGRYRIWLWMLAACVATSVIETTSVGTLARVACRVMADAVSLRNDLLLPATVGLIAAGLCVRLFFEIRRCPWATASLVTCALCFVVAAIAAWNRPAADERWLLVKASWLAGHVLILATFLLYSRHVQLDVTGRIAVRTRRKESPPVTRPSEDSESDEAAAKPAIRLRTDLDPIESPAADPPRSESVMPLARHLSKAERRRLRREARMAS
jgi:hypothetical protein